MLLDKKLSFDKSFVSLERGEMGGFCLLGRRLGRLLLKVRGGILAVLLLLGAVVAILTIKFNGVSYFGYRLFHVLSYGTRPLWDQDKQTDFTDIPFFGTSMKTFLPTALS